MVGNKRKKAIKVKVIIGQIKFLFLVAFAPGIDMNKKAEV